MSENRKSIPTILKERFMVFPPVDNDPRDFSNRKKNIIIIGLALCGGISGFSSTIYFPGIPDITSELNAPPIATTLTAALFILFMGIAPVFWASASDHFHIRRFLFIVSMIIFGFAALGAVFVQNIWALVALRCVQAIGASCGASVGAGVIADCYPVEKRGAAFGKYFFGVFIGPLLGPIVGGLLIISPITWRATFWFCFAFAFFIISYIVIMFPETYRLPEKFDIKLPTIIQDSASDSSPSPTIENQSTTEESKSVEEKQTKDDFDTKKRIESPTPSKTSAKKRINPLSAFLLLRHPFVLIAAIISGIAFGAMFAVETIIPDIYTTNYGFNSWQTGLSYLGAGVGNLCGSILGGMLSDRLLLRARKQRGGKAIVEDRLTLNLWPAAILNIFGILLFGWSAYYRLSVWAAIVGFGIQNFGMNQLTTATSAYLVDAMPGSSASSATAAANLIRMIFACVFTLTANPMVAAVGAGWTAVLLAAFTVVAIGLLIVLKIYGARLRKWSGYGDKDN